MTWTKTSDDHPDRRLDLSDAAYRLEHAALTYSNRYGRDGRLRKDWLRMLAVPASCLAPEVIGELVAARLWFDDGDAFEIVGYFDSQPSAEEVELERAWSAARRRLSRAPEEDRDRLKAESEDARLAYTDAVARRKARALSQRDAHRDARSESLRPVPVPVSPVPVPDPDPEPVDGSSSAREGRVGGGPGEPRKRVDKSKSTGRRRRGSPTKVGDMVPGASPPSKNGTDPEAHERHRLEAIRLIASHEVNGTVAEKLRADYHLTDDDIDAWVPTSTVAIS